MKVIAKKIMAPPRCRRIDNSQWQGGFQPIIALPIEWM
jgi:hypothetical protein